jgi:hypothetical protein
MATASIAKKQYMTQEIDPAILLETARLLGVNQPEP